MVVHDGANALPTPRSHFCSRRDRRFCCEHHRVTYMSLPTVVARSSRNQDKKAAAAARASANIAARKPGNVAPLPPPIEPSRFDFVSTKEVEKTKRKPGDVKLPAGVRNGAVLFLPRESHTQNSNLPASASGSGALQALLTGNGKRARVEGVFDDDPLEYAGNEDDDVGRVLVPVQAVSRHRRRRLKQHDNWLANLNEDTIALFLEQLHGKEHPQRLRPGCFCKKRHLDVTLADWDGTLALETLALGAEVTCSVHPDGRVDMQLCRRARAAPCSRLLPMRAAPPVDGIQLRPPRIYINPFSQRFAQCHSLVGYPRNVLGTAWYTVALTSEFFAWAPI